VKPELAAELQKVLFKGKVLQDADTLQDHGIIDGDFVVIMMAKAKEAPPPAAAVAPPAPPVAPAAAASAPPADAAAQAAENELAIQSLCDMGFPRELVRQCLRAAFNNPDRAVEYLTSGIPAHLQHLATGEAPPPPPATPTPSPVVPAPPPQPSAGPTQVPSRPMIPPQDTGPLAQLANHPRFNQLRAAVQQHPSTLNQVLTLIAKGDPNMITEIAEHQEEFVRLLSLPPAPNDPITAMLQAAQAGGVAPGAPGQAPAPPPQLGAAGEEAIQRLQQLGFARNLCVEAYLACERNEEMAANFLFDRMEE